MHRTGLGLAGLPWSGLFVLLALTTGAAREHPVLGGARAARPARAAVPVSQESDSTAVADLLALEKAWIDAEVGHDRIALERILDEGFLATFASGATIDRTAFIERIMKASIEPFEVRTEAIRVHGDAAVVIDTSMDGGTKFTWIAVRRDRRWRVISETFTRIATG